VKLDVDMRRVIVGPKEALSTRTVPVREINWLGDAPFDSRDELGPRSRSRSAPPAPRARR
jgi:tRNA-uridine 2-sulfurtransferase